MKFVATLVLSFVLCAVAQAEEAWPQRPITIVVPFLAGGSADLLARIVQQHMQADFGSPVVVENRSGAGGSIGTAYVAKAPPDGGSLRDRPQAACCTASGALVRIR